MLFTYKSHHPHGRFLIPRIVEKPVETVEIVAPAEKEGKAEDAKVDDTSEPPEKKSRMEGNAEEPQGKKKKNRGQNKSRTVPFKEAVVGKARPDQCDRTVGRECVRVEKHLRLTVQLILHVQDTGKGEKGS